VAVTLWVLRSSSRHSETGEAGAGAVEEAALLARSTPPQAHHSAHRKEGERKGGKGGEEKGRDTATLASQVRADQALLLRSKMMSQVGTTPSLSLSLTHAHIDTHIHKPPRTPTHTHSTSALHTQATSRNERHTNIPSIFMHTCHIMYPLSMAFM
jgi:hypothetical protein